MRLSYCTSSYYQPFLFRLKRKCYVSDFPTDLYTLKLTGNNGKYRGDLWIKKSENGSDWKSKIAAMLKIYFELFFPN